MEELSVNIKIEGCIGCGNCLYFCPEVFDLDDETNEAYNKLDSKIEDDILIACVEDAAEHCPMKAIKVES